MHQESRELKKREREELAGIVAWSAQIGRAVLFLLSMVIVGFIFRALLSLMSIEEPFWIVPTLILGYLLYRRAERWTGGPVLRRHVRQDLEDGSVRITVIEPADVTEVEELEDEGPSYIVKTGEDDWILLSGQEMLPYKRRGFPWSKFGVEEAPHSGVFFGLTRMGDPVPVDRKIPPMSYELARDLGTFKRTFIVLDDAARALLDEAHVLE